jgi:site-specific DNA-cytosine methylase
MAARHPRQALARARVHSDVRHVGDGCEPVDLIAGGFPCKGASTAGKRNGFDHPETVLWREMARAVGELRPRYVLVENVANILALHDGAVWGEVLGDLAALGYDVVWDCLPAAAVGAPHGRDRVFAVAAHGRAGWSRVVPYPCVAAVPAGDPGPPYTTRPAHPGDAVVTRSPIKETTR